MAVFLLSSQTLPFSYSLRSTEFINDPAYAKYRQARQSGSISSLHLIDDTDLAGTIRYLPKG